MPQPGRHVLRSGAPPILIVLTLRSILIQSQHGSFTNLSLMLTKRSMSSGGDTLFRRSLRRNREPLSSGNAHIEGR